MTTTTKFNRGFAGTLQNGTPVYVINEGTLSDGTPAWKVQLGTFGRYYSSGMYVTRDVNFSGKIGMVAKTRVTRGSGR
jgi:predicted heme/steroid binding protein